MARINIQRLQPTMDQYGGSTGHSNYSYAELAVSSLAVAQTITSTHCLPVEGWPGILYQLPPLLLAIFWIL